MDVNMKNTVSQIIEIEDDVIDLDAADRTPEEVIYEWDAKIRKKMSMFAMVDNENVLGDIMKEYLQSLQEMASSYEDNETLKHKVFCHISFLYSYYTELQCCAPDSYLNNMEDILTLYCNLELNIIQPLKKKDLSKHKYKKRIVSVTRQIIHVLTVYLLEHHDHILHVLIKMNTSNQVSDPCSEVLNVLYSHFLTKVPAFNLCDETFCRNYVAFQKWKVIRHTEDWGGMDKIMYKMFKRTPESIQNSEMLRQILMPICHEEVDIISNVFCSYRAIFKAYFKHVVAKTNVEIDDLEFNIDLGEDEPTVPVDNEDEEEVQFLKVYYEIERNMSNLSNITNVSDVDIFRKCKEEVDEDDDVLFVGDMLQSQPLLDFAIDNEKTGDCRMSNEDNTEIKGIPLSSETENFANDKNTEIENLNGINRICEGNPGTLETCDSQTTEAQKMEEPLEQRICLINNEKPSYNVTKEVDQPKVSFTSNNTQVPSPFDSNNIFTTVCDSTFNKEAAGMKSVEVQADNIQNFVYNDYGLTTPPFDVPLDEHLSRSIEPRLYANISRHHARDLSPEKENVCSKSIITASAIKVHVDSSNVHKNCSYNDYGLTPPNDSHVEDLSARLHGTRIYANISHKDLNDKMEENFDDCEQLCAYSSEILQKAGVTQESETENLHFNDVILSNTGQVTNEYEETGSNVNYMIGQNSEYDEFEDQLNTSEMTDVAAEYDNEITNLDSCHYTHKNSHLIRNKSNNHSEALDVTLKNSDLREVPLESRIVFKASDQIDTGQEILNVTEVLATKDKPSENYNGNTFLRSTSTRTNGQANDISNTTSTRIIHTLINNYHTFNKTLSAPVSKHVPAKHKSSNPHNIFGRESNSKPNSIHDTPSPSYEGMDDFAAYLRESMNSVTSPNHVKKNRDTKKKNVRFAADTHDNSLEERSQSGRVLKPKRIQREVKNNTNISAESHNGEERRSQSQHILKEEITQPDLKVALKRNPTIDKAVAKMIENMPKEFIRVDYDKSTKHLGENDLVRYNSTENDICLTFIVNNRKPGKSPETELNSPNPINPTLVNSEANFSEFLTFLQTTDESIPCYSEKTRAEDVNFTSLHNFETDVSHSHNSSFLNSDDVKINYLFENNLNQANVSCNDVRPQPTKVPNSYGIYKFPNFTLPPKKRRYATTTEENVIKDQKFLETGRENFNMTGRENFQETAQENSQECVQENFREPVLGNTQEIDPVNSQETDQENYRKYNTHHLPGTHAYNQQSGTRYRTKGEKKVYLNTNFLDNVLHSGSCSNNVYYNNLCFTNTLDANSKKHFAYSNAHSNNTASASHSPNHAGFRGPSSSQKKKRNKKPEKSIAKKRKK